MTVRPQPRPRELFGSGAWGACRDALVEAEAAGPLTPDDLELLATSAYLVGREDDCIEALSRGHLAHLTAGDARGAVRTAFWAAFILYNAGEPARGTAWAARARSLVAEHGLDGLEPALLTALDAHLLLEEGRTVEAVALARQAVAVSEELGDGDLRALARLTVGWGLVLLGDCAGAAAEMDDVMVSVSAAETGPVVAGVAYCAVIACCLALLDVDRARAWTAELSRWCSARSDLVPYRDQCRVHRSQILTLAGAWDDAAHEAEDAGDRPPAGGGAAYQLGELHRLRGEEEAAEAAYRRANTLGREPEPGLLRLRLAQGRHAAAVRTVHRLLREPRAPADRADVLAAAVDVDVAVGDLDAAGVAADELTGLAARLGSAMLTAEAARCRGAVALAAGHPDDALGLLRQSWRGWHDLAVPHPAAQARVLLACAYRALGDEDASAMELDAAREVFEGLGARPDVEQVERLSLRPAGARGLTPREVEVVRLVAAGKSNREVARDLVLSEKTVARHLSNVYTKLGISSRAAATAYAYDHRLV